MWIKEFIEVMRDEQMGFQFGAPWRYEENSITCVVPITRSGVVPFHGPPEADYSVLSQTEKVTIEDTGSINKMLVINEEERPVFIRMGELFKGATQERAATMSRVIMPGQKEEIDVACVHASKPIVKGAAFASSGYVPKRDNMYNTVNLAATRGQSASGGQHTQSTSWAADRGYHASTQSAGFETKAMQDDITKVRDEVNKNLKDVLEKVPLVENQIGVVLIDTKGTYALDAFNFHEPFKAVKEAIIEKESLSIAEKDKGGVFEYKPEKANETIKTTLKEEYKDEVAFKSDNTETILLDWKEYTGEAVTLNGDCIHLLLARKEKE